jgi:hypothetical protein
MRKLSTLSKLLGSCKRKCQFATRSNSEKDEYRFRRGKRIEKKLSKLRKREKKKYDE